MNNKSSVEVLTLARALSIFGYHLHCIATNKGNMSKFGLHFYGGVSVKEIIVVPAGDPNSDWDQVVFDGVLVGNRCGAREEYVRRCAPILEKIARGEEIE